jgi:hypothetical protein
MKRIYIDSAEAIEEWVDANKLTIINTLYDNIFDFSKSDEQNRLVLKVMVKPKGYQRRKTDDLDIDSIAFDFILIKDEIKNSISTLIERFEEIEDYEKCSELVKLKNEL